ncbi:MAG: hypothetical protein JOZ43_00365 [Acidobacteriales bacterium]|nr:hypothetical protein [Terriglobales bacterium]
MSNSYRRRSLMGPIVLIALGVLMLLAVTHRLHADQIGLWFARYWPAILIVWGVVRLVEFFTARQTNAPTPRFGAGAIVLVVFLVIIGQAATAAHRNLQVGMNLNGDDWSPEFTEMFQGDAHDYQFQREIPLNGKQLTFSADRADIVVSPSTDGKARLTSNLTVYAHSQEEADSVRNRIEKDLSLSDGTISVGHSGQTKASFTLEVPDQVALQLTNTHGDINIRDRKAPVTIDTQRSDITVENIDDNLTVHSQSRSNLTVHQAKGNVSATGKYDDVTATDIAGSMTMEGDFFGDMRLQKIDKGVHFHSSRTDLELAKVEGELTMSSGDLQGTQVAGPVRVITRSKDIHFQRISGDVDIENQNASVELEPESPVGNVRVHNSRGPIEFVAPSGSGFVLQARADRGEISSELDLPVQQDKENHSTEGTYGKGGNQVMLTADRGSINLRKQ